MFRAVRTTGLTLIIIILLTVAAVFLREAKSAGLPVGKWRKVTYDKTLLDPHG